MFELCHFDPKVKKNAPGKICQRILLPVKQVMTQCRALTELVSTQMSQLGCRPRVKPLPRGTSAARWPWTPGSRISQRDTKDSLGNRSFQKLSKLHMVSQQKSAKILENLGFFYDWHWKGQMEWNRFVWVFWGWFWVAHSWPTFQEQQAIYLVTLN